MEATVLADTRVRHTGKEHTPHRKRASAAKPPPKVFYATKKHIFPERSTIFMH